MLSEGDLARVGALVSASFLSLHTHVVRLAASGEWQALVGCGATRCTQTLHLPEDGGEKRRECWLSQGCRLASSLSWLQHRGALQYLCRGADDGRLLSAYNFLKYENNSTVESLAHHRQSQL